MQYSEEQAEHKIKCLSKTSENTSESTRLGAKKISFDAYFSVSGLYGSVFLYFFTPINFIILSMIKVFIRYCHILEITQNTLSLALTKLKITNTWYFFYDSIYFFYIFQQDSLSWKGPQDVSRENSCPKPEEL